jgi:hypothetical protein
LRRDVNTTKLSEIAVPGSSLIVGELGFAQFFVVLSSGSSQDPAISFLWMLLQWAAAVWPWG